MQPQSDSPDYRTYETLPEWFRDVVGTESELRRLGRLGLMPRAIQISPKRKGLYNLTAILRALEQAQ